MSRSTPRFRTINLMSGFQSVLPLRSRRPFRLPRASKASFTASGSTRWPRAAAAAAVNGSDSRPRPEGTWLYYSYNAEYLFYPFAETRTVGEMLAFHAEERRAAIAGLCDRPLRLRSGQGRQCGLAPRTRISTRSGYYRARGRDGPDGEPLERQFDFFGGLRWRSRGEHIPETRRKIDRIALFRARRGPSPLTPTTG